MHARGVATKWQSRRKISLGPVRRACPASGATWNVQVVRGKMTSRCLWHACRALALGLFLMLVGAGMATIGYYAEHILPHTEARNNMTVRAKPDSKGIQLHNLSYAGPIVMGCGGFIIVAACVMTFETRESSAKVVPARFKLSSNNRGTRANSSRRTTASGMSSNVGSQTRWDNHLGVFRTSPGDNNPSQSRNAQTAALVHFSKIIGSAHYSNHSRNRRFSRSGSVPNLSSTCDRSPTIVKQSSISPTAQRIRQHHRTSRNDRYARGDSIGNKRERNKRSDTSKRHVLSRQKQIDNTEMHNNISKAPISELRSNSTNSDISNMFRKGGKSSNVPRTPSVDSRGVQTDEISEKPIVTTCLYRKSLITQTSSPSVEGAKFKSQLSVCSEPSNIPTYQSSANESGEVPIVPHPSIAARTSQKLTVEESKISEEQSLQIKRPTTLVLDCNRVERFLASTSLEKKAKNEYQPTENACGNASVQQTRISPKPLFRSNSSSLHKRQSTFVPAATASGSSKFKLSSELDQIFVISSNRASNIDDDNYDSIEVIDERRLKNMKDRAKLYKSNTLICASNEKTNEENIIK